MSKLEKLIQQYCPDGVEYVRLGDVAQVCRGTRVVRSQLTEVGYPVYQNCLTPMGCFEDTNCPKGTTFVICGGAAGNVGYTDVDCWAADDCEYIECSHTILNRYVYYCLMSKQHYLLSKVRKASIPRLSPNVIKDLEIPVPPLPVQEEIVRVLDTFTELQAELQKRKQQYNFYRDNLLNFKDINRGGQETKWMKLGKICSVLRGKRLTKSQLSSYGRYKVFHGGIEPIGHYDECNREANTTMVINVGASAGTVGFSRDAFWSSDGCFCLSQNQLFSGRYLYYYLQTKEPYLMSRVRKAGIPTLDGKVLEELIIPIPPLAEQNRIVAILDRFDTLTNDLTSGLPAEMEKRRQQYEFYRDKLLTFKRKEA